MGGIEAALAEHAFEHLFIECLGWDRIRSTVTASHCGAALELTGIAQKRGFTVFLCPAHRTVLANRRLLREIQRQLRKTHHEHILIYYCETPRKQVWQWATTIGGKRTLLHREHPFFSKHPPQRLLERIEGLSVSLQEEEQTTLPDVLDRVRTALLPNSDLNLFARRPRFVVQSDRLAMAMKKGDTTAFDQFIALHRPLARHASKRLMRWFDMAPEDAEQTAIIGLILAARRWDPEKGYQFSTYAHHWLLHACERYGQKWGTWFHLPANWFFSCFRLTFARFELIAALGEREADRHFDEKLSAEGITREQWQTFCAARDIEYLRDLEPSRLKALDFERRESIVDQALRKELQDGVACGLKCLAPRQAEILRLRYGLKGHEHTLEQIAEMLGITRERVRQIQAKAEEKLQRHLGRKSLFDDYGPSDEPPAEAEVEETTA